MTITSHTHTQKRTDLNYLFQSLRYLLKPSDILNMPWRVFLLHIHIHTRVRARTRTNPHLKTTTTKQTKSLTQLGTRIRRLVQGSKTATLIMYWTSNFRRTLLTNIIIKGKMRIAFLLTLACRYGNVSLSDDVQDSCGKRKVLTAYAYFF